MTEFSDGTTTADYAYRADGMRVEKATSANVYTTYAYDGQMPVEELDGSRLIGDDRDPLRLRGERHRLSLEDDKLGYDSLLPNLRHAWKHGGYARSIRVE